MKKEYTNPELEIILLLDSDVIATSDTSVDAGDDSMWGD